MQRRSCRQLTSCGSGLKQRSAAASPALWVSTLGSLTPDELAPSKEFVPSKYLLLDLNAGCCSKSMGRKEDPPCRLHICG